MKKIFSLFLIAISQPAISQITIGNADMPVVNDTVRLSTTTDQWSIDPTLTGANYNWDFSFLTPQAQRLDTFKAVGSTPFAYQFYFNNQVSYPDHKADYALPGEDFGFPGYFEVTEVYNFFKNDNNQFKNVGFGAKMNGLPMSIRNMPIDTVYQFPLTDPSTYSSFSSWEIPSNGTFYYRQRKWVDASVDGYGSVTTPLGTFNAIRVKLIIDVEDSIYVDSFGFGWLTNRPQETQYHWLANGEDVPVLQINSINNTITRIIYKDFPSDVSVEEIEYDLQLTLFPNPATGILNIMLPGEEGLIEIYNPEGKTFESIPVNGLPGLKTISTENYPAGLYLMKFSGNSRTWNGRFIVRK